MLGWCVVGLVGLFWLVGLVGLVGSAGWVGRFGFVSLVSVWVRVWLRLGWVGLGGWLCLVGLVWSVGRLVGCLGGWLVGRLIGSVVGPLSTCAFLTSRLEHRRLLSGGRQSLSFVRGVSSMARE